MSEEPFNRRYQRRFSDPFDCQKRRQFADNAVQQTYEQVQELSTALAAERLAQDLEGLLLRVADPAEAARRERRRQAQIEGWVAGEPGE